VTVSDAVEGACWGLVRPEDLDLVAEPGAGASVLDVEYYGHDQLVTVALSSGLEVRARLHARHRFEPGTRVTVRLGGLGVVVFPRAASFVSDT
jgi:ABC-type sugar transport system ATPase subunit